MTTTNDWASKMDAVVQTAIDGIKAGRIIDCYECGHPHFDATTELYVECLIEECDCGGQDLNGRPVSRAERMLK